jgi:hypothetical protein
LPSAALGKTLGHQRQDLALAIGELGEGVVFPATPDQPRHQLRVDDDLAGRDPADVDGERAEILTPGP